MNRCCSHCGNMDFKEGYVIENGLEYYCNEECLNEHYSKEEWENMYNNGESDSYWTEWED